MKKWEDDVNNFMKNRENENQHSNDLIHDDTWLWEWQDKEAWGIPVKDFAQINK